MHRLQLLVLVIGILIQGLAYAQDEDEEDRLARKGLVTVEPAYVVSTEVDGEYKLVPYEERRGKWGSLISIGYSTYEPIYYEPNFIAEDFANIYTTPELPMIELKLAYRRNLSFGSLGGELAVGFYQNESDAPDLVDSTLLLIPIHLGVLVSLDNLWNEPYLVPYGSAGAYTVFHREKMGAQTKNGTTQAAPYFNAGVALQLNWLDKVAARRSYIESGIQNTYAYAEMQWKMPSSNEADEDFGNDISYSGGLKIEF